MKRTYRLRAATPAFLAAAALAAPAFATDLPHLDAHADAAPVVRTATARLAPGLAPSVASVDEQVGVPTLVRFPAGTGGGALATAPFGDAAKTWMSRVRGLYGLTQAAVDAAVVAHVHDVGRGGVVVTLRQRVSGVDVFRGDAKVLLDRNRDLVAVSGHLHPEAAGSLKGGAGAFRLAAAEVVAIATADLAGVPVSAALLGALGDRPGGYKAFDLAGDALTRARGLHFVEPARARRVLFPLPDRVVPAYYVEVWLGRAGAPTDAYAWVVAADDGRLLYREDLTQTDAFAYRVWADPAGDKRPFDGPIIDYTPHPSGKPDGSFPGFVTPNLVVAGGFNKTSDPWLPNGAVETKGNNVDAYTDRDAVDGFSAGDVRASATGPGTFDRTFDTGVDPIASGAQGEAAATHLFYVNNWLHDHWYDSGFDEAAGNAQADNYGRGGLAGDAMRAEAQDGALTGSINNANMKTGADGTPPRMQMFLWNGKTTVSLKLAPQNATPPVGYANFGPSTFNVTAQVATGLDNQAPTADACQPITSNVAGKVALVDRGACSYETKAQNAQAAGAVGLIIVDNTNAALPPTMGDDANIVAPTNIGVVSTTTTDGNAIKAALQNGPVTATMTRVTAPRRDGTIDGSIIAHEWGHYLHHRLVACGSTQCGGESEGWGDFSALYMSIRATDDLAGTFAVGQYATSGITNDAGYFGLRRFPYSVDMTRDPLTFGHIANGAALPANAPMNPVAAPNSEVHNAGEIWGSMMADAYFALLSTSQGPNAKRTFDQARRLTADMVVGGMKLAPIDPTYTEQRDALLAALATLAPADVGLVAAAFARRGAGACAVSPPRASQDLVGVVESFENKSRAVLGAVTLTDDVVTCDGDGRLDAGEVGHLTVALTNTGSAPMKGASVTFATAGVGVAFPGGATASFPTIAPYATEKATLLVSLDKAAPQRAYVPFDVTVSTPDACVAQSATKATLLTNFDEVAASSTVDAFESDLEAWTRDGKKASDVWTHEASTPEDRVWHALDYPSNSDTRLVSPNLVVGAAEDLVLVFEHRFKFETGPDGQNGPIVNWDGGLIEVTTDGGATWVDASTLAAVGYTGTIGDAGNKAHNPLNGRKGFVGQSASWPATDKLAVSFGKQLAGKTIRVRFRVGSDDASGDFGWEIDDVGFLGLVGTPFPSIGDDKGVCNAAPVAVVGPDQVVASGAHVVLDAQASSDPDGDPLSFAWTQTAGPAVAVAGAGTAVASFDAPIVAADTALSFVVGVSDGKASASAKSNVIVAALVVTPDAGAGGQAGVDAGAGGAGAGGGNVGGANAGGSNVGGANTGGGNVGGSSAGGSGAGGAGGSGTAVGGAGGLGGQGLGGSGPLGGGGMADAGVGGAHATTTTGTGGSGTLFDTGVESRGPLQPSDDPGGCGCEAAGAPSAARGWLALIAPIAAVFARRRRRDRRA